MSRVEMSDNYDRIARFYDVDMARNMRFDDVAFYAQVCARRPGRTLELGCGSGRILLDLLASGIDITGIDASAGMLHELRRKATARGLAARVILMDLRKLALSRGFDVVLCPYSLVTYLTGAGALADLLLEIGDILRPGGFLAVDAFVPRPVAATAGFTLDYERPFGAGTLARWKRVAPLGELNRIERRYCVRAANGATVEEVEIVEEIRPCSPETLLGAVARAGYRIEATSWDYATPGAAAGAQYFTVTATFG